MATVVKTNTHALLEAAVAQAAAALRAGQVVAVPTETVYGLAANALNPEAVAKIFALKGRPAHNPIIVHVASLVMAHACVAAWTESATKLAAAFWPGPLTLVLAKAPEIPALVTAGGPTVGVRWPSHPVIQEIIQRCGFPLAAPSANLSGQVSPSTAEHVARTLGDSLSLIIDGGPCEIGIESTVLDLSVQPARLLRPGMIHLESLSAVIGAVASGHAEHSGVLRSPGLLLKHYSPHAKLMLWTPTESLSAVYGTANRAHLLTRGPIPPDATFAQICRMPAEPGGFARALYAELHRADQAGAELIVVEAVPPTLEWQAVADRLRRAAAS